ncbi:drug/metabolite transporter (DMT)-like permease [Tamilnaduibacter salinus]|uniref:Drug/metabolite transporter (DMT)-like permease n=1 Tax=Tamilnaduibacter salinus TaxID=1484056 RepID=A0A2U1CWZ0_9GAMM|nr:DMT family transporter [Tamilnaduibacter salinus]PVY76777.1 drug/metabolite transporter (DMT)-like permease [Tamilnaduibacter salinus]
MTSAHSLRWRGFVIAGLGVLFLSPDSLLVKATSVTPVVFLFWRGLLIGLSFLVINHLRYGRDLPIQMRRCGKRGLYCGVAFAGSTLGFVTGVKYTAAGNVLVILNTAPVIAALIAWLVWKERLPLRTWILILICVGGASLMAVGEMGGGEPIGLVMAGVAAFSLASNLAVARSRPEADMSVMLIIGAVLVAVTAALFGGAQWPGWRDFGLIVLLCVGFLPVASILIQTGPRYLPAAEVSLFLLLETVLGTLLVWFFLGELPGPLGFLGGSIILGSLAVNGVIEDWKERRALGHP